MIWFMRRHRRTITRVVALLMLLAIILTLVLSGCSAAPKVAETRTISVWTYYNGDQLEAFNTLVEEYNNTEGAANSVRVESYNVGGVSDLEETVLKAARGEAGADPMPNIFAAYGDNAYSVDEYDLLADLSPYLTAEEKDRYVEGYLKEGAIKNEDEIKLFPVAKSVEVMLLNRTEWDPFEKATGAKLTDLETMEGLVSVSKAYYEWTDSLTPDIPDDGHAFYGRDSMANLIFIGSMQLGTEIISVKDGNVTINFDRDVMRKIWDNYYVPYIRGYFASDGRFRSDDIKTGTIIALTGSSTGSTYFPTEVMEDDMSTHEIEMTVLKAPRFKDGADIAVQQGAGMAVTNTSEEDVNASVGFLKWLTRTENNLNFSVMSGYLPVLKEANSIEAVEEADIETDQRMSDLLEVAFDTVKSNSLYTPKPFYNGTAFRAVLENALSDQAQQDRLIVEENLAQGMSLEEATEQFLTDNNFNNWYNKTAKKLKDLAE